MLGRLYGGRSKAKSPIPLRYTNFGQLTSQRARRMVAASDFTGHRIRGRSFLFCKFNPPMEVCIMASKKASKNVEALRAAHKSWNRRDFQGVVANAADGLAYTDNARGLKLNSRTAFREWTEAWAKAFSDAKITNPTYIDAGDVVIAQFTAVGTNDGAFGDRKSV